MQMDDLHRINHLASSYHDEALSVIFVFGEYDEGIANILNEYAYEHQVVEIMDNEHRPVTSKTVRVSLAVQAIPEVVRAVVGINGAIYQIRMDE